jgi:SAM-dependent methyltransferase
MRTVATGEGNSGHRGAWEGRAETYDQWYGTFEGALEHQVDWELLARHLPQDRGATILDAAGGTGRMSLPLAKLGYSVTLCDISPAMLAVAREKLAGAGLACAVEILECDARHLPFDDGTFDFVICWDGAGEFVGELARVARVGAVVSAFFVSKWSAAVREFYKDPGLASSLVESRRLGVADVAGGRAGVTADQAKDLFAENGLRVLNIYAVCGWMDYLRVPDDVRRAREWDERLFLQAARMLLGLAQEPSVQGMSRHLAVYGERM